MGACGTCGARLDSAAENAAVTCTDCGTVQHARPAGRRAVDPDWAALAGGFDPDAPPDLVVPFALDRAEARLVLRAWVKHRWFAPRGFRRIDESVTGTFLPHWTWAARTRSRYVGERGDYFYVKGVGGRPERHTKWCPASGTVDADFEEVMVAASRRADPLRLDGLSWDAKGTLPFRPDLVAGREVPHCEVGPELGLAQAKEAMSRAIEERVRRDIGGDAQRVRSVDTEYSRLRLRLLLLPVWLGAYVHGGRTRQVLVSGQSGAVSGERPWSAAKLALGVFAVLLVTSVALFFLGMSE